MRILENGQAPLAAAQADVVPGPAARILAILHDDTKYLAVELAWPVALNQDVLSSLRILYNSGRDYLWYLEPSEESSEPSLQEMASALEQVARSRDEIRAAIQDYKNAIRSALTRNESEFDTGLPDALRDRLFAIRGHLLGAPAVLEPEERVWYAVEKADESVQVLEPLAAWANRSTLDQELPTSVSAPEWERFEERSENEIDLTQTVRWEALACLPPKGSEGTAKFPPLDKDVVMHILLQHRGNDPAISLLQDLWRLESWGGGSRRVRRTATLVSIDSKTGNQKLVIGTAKYYTSRPDDTLEEIYEQYGGQDLPLEAVRK